jgi:hypothetical protein
MSEGNPVGRKRIRGEENKRGGEEEVNRSRGTRKMQSVMIAGKK